MENNGSSEEGYTSVVVKQLPNVKQLSFQSFALTPQPTPVRADPVIKWVGGKTQLLPQFEQLFPRSYNRYFEPFIGGGAVFFHLRPKTAVLNDVNPHLAALYKFLQTNVGEIILILSSLRHTYLALPKTERETVYYKLRERYNELPTNSVEKAALLVFLNKTGYNGLYRENGHGRLNVPFGRYENPSIYDEANLRAVSHTLQSATILNTGFAETVAGANEGDFVYFDPPYMPISRTASFTSYTKNQFGEAEQIALAKVFRLLANRNVFVMLSNSDSPIIRELYKGFEQHEVKASRMVNSKADSRGKITELVVTNYAV